MKSLPDSAKSQVMQAAAQQPFILWVYYTSHNRYLYGTSCDQIPEKWEFDSLVMEIYGFSEEELHLDEEFVWRRVLVKRVQNRPNCNLGRN